MTFALPDPSDASATRTTFCRVLRDHGLGLEPQTSEAVSDLSQNTRRV